MVLNDAPLDRECCRKRVEVSAPRMVGGFQVNFCAERFSCFFSSFCPAAGLNCFFKSHIWCAQRLLKRAHTQRCFSLMGSVCFAQSCAKFHTSRDIRAQLLAVY